MFKKIHFILFMLLISVALVGVSCLGEDDDGDGDAGQIMGTVYDAATSQPLQGVEITTDPATSVVITDQNGQYTIQDVEAGTYTVQATKEGYTLNFKTVSVTDGKTATADFQLTPATPKLAVSEVTLDFGKTETALTFDIYNDGAGSLSWTVTDTVNWIAVAPASGTNETDTTTVTVTVDRSNVTAGTYTSYLMISSSGGQKEIVVLMTKEMQNNPPTADFIVTPLTGNLETVFNVDASNSSDDNDPIGDLQVRWRWEAGGSFTNWTTTKSASHQYTTEGQKTITLEVRDTAGETSSTSKSVTVTEQGQAPVASFTVTPESGGLDTTFEVDASGSHDDSDPIESLEVRWQWESGAGFTAWTTDKTASHQYSTAGNKTITLEVRDTDGLIGSTTETVTVSSGETPPILVVDDDGSAWNSPEFSDVQAMYTDALDANGVEYDVLDLDIQGGNGPDFATLSQYQVVIWFTGECWDNFETLTPTDEDNLGQYLDNGGNLFLSGMDYLYDRYPNAGTFSAGDFPYDYLHVNEVYQDAWQITTGTTTGGAGSVADGMTFSLTDPFTSSRDGLFIDYLSHDQTTVFTMSGGVTGPGALQYEGDYNVVFTTLSFAGLVDGSNGTKAELMGNILNFFGLTPAQ